MSEVVEGTYRDGDRVRRLREVLTIAETQFPEMGIERILFVETVELWIEVLTVGTRFALAIDASPGERTDAEQTSLVSHMDQTKVAAAIEGLTGVTPHEPDAPRQAAWIALATLRTELATVTATMAGARGAGLPRLFADSSNPHELDTAAHISVWRSRVTLLSEFARTQDVISRAEEQVTKLSVSVAASAQEAEVATQQLDTIRADLAESRAERAQGRLADQFKELGNREGASSYWFRCAAFVLLVVAAAVGIWLGKDGADDWQATVTDVAVVGVLGGASAYAARLAAVHRGTADWAESIRVQLETFQDFLGVIKDDETRHRVYEDFGRRVLGPPPVGGDDPGGVPAAQLFELLTAASRRSPREGA